MSTDGDRSPGSPRPASKRTMGLALRRLLRTRVVAGILTVLPIWITWAIVKFVFNLMRGATEPLARWIADPYFSDPSIVPETVQRYVDRLVPIAAVLLTLFFLYLLGLFTTNVFGRRVLAMLERLVDRVPLVKTIYRSTKQIVASLSGQSEMSAGRVVLIEFPRPGMKCVGFLTSILRDTDTGRSLCTVFIPTTPNPTTGYMQIVPASEVWETGWTVEEAVKVVMSGGVIAPPRVPFDRGRPAVTDGGPLAGAA